MSDHPILYSGPMIRALLEGRKTQTRRVVKRLRGWPEHSFCDLVLQPPAVWWWDGKHERLGVRQDCPYGQPGDLLWVRETISRSTTTPGYMAYSPDDQLVYDGERGWPSSIERRKTIVSIHMPRWASRLTLRITDVRVERLQKISEADAIAEGISPEWEPGCSGRLMEAIGGFSFRPAASAYADLWESINGPGSWDANPWVWVISFDVIKANIDQVKP